MHHGWSQLGARVWCPRPGRHTSVRAPVVRGDLIHQLGLIVPCPCTITQHHTSTTRRGRHLSIQDGSVPRDAYTPSDATEHERT
jgi:hypothetical protein